MTVRDIVNRFAGKKIPDNTIYKMSLDGKISKFKVFAVYEHNHHALVVEQSTKMAQTISDPMGEFFLTPKECVEYSIKCIKRRIEMDKQELKRLKSIASKQ